MSQKNVQVLADDLAFQEKIEDYQLAIDWDYPVIPRAQSGQAGQESWNPIRLFKQSIWMSKQLLSPHPGFFESFLGACVMNVISANDSHNYFIFSLHHSSHPARIFQSFKS
jgi:hypothetical protein